MMYFLYAAIPFLIGGSVSTITDNCLNEREFIVGCVRFVQHDYLYNDCELH